MIILTKTSIQGFLIFNRYANQLYEKPLKEIKMFFHCMSKIFKKVLESRLFYVKEKCVHHRRSYYTICRLEQFTAAAATLKRHDYLWSHHCQTLQMKIWQNGCSSNGLYQNLPKTCACEWMNICMRICFVFSSFLCETSSFFEKYWNQIFFFHPATKI